MVAKKGHFTALRSIEGVQQANFGRRTHTWEHVFFFPECADAVFQITEKPSTSEQAKEDVRGGSSGASQISIESDDLSGLEPVAKRTRMLEPCTKVLTTSQREAAAAMCLRRQGCAEARSKSGQHSLHPGLCRRAIPRNVAEPCEGTVQTNLFHSTLVRKGWFHCSRFLCAGESYLASFPSSSSTLQE